MIHRCCLWERVLCKKNHGYQIKQPTIQLYRVHSVPRPAQVTHSGRSPRQRGIMFSAEMEALVERWNAKLARESAKLARVAPDSEDVCAFHFALLAKKHYDITREFEVHLVQSKTNKILAITYVKPEISKRGVPSTRMEIDLLTKSPTMYGLGLTSMTFALTLLLLASSDRQVGSVMLNAISVGTLFVLAPYNPSNYNVEMTKTLHDVGGTILQVAQKLARLPSGAFENVKVYMGLNEQTTEIAARQLDERIAGPKLRIVCARALRKARVARAMAEITTGATTMSVKQSRQIRTLLKISERPADSVFFAEVARELAQLTQQHLTLLGSSLEEKGGTAIGLVLAKACKSLARAAQKEHVDRQEARNAVVRFTVEFAQAFDDSEVSAFAILKWLKRLDDASAKETLKRAKKAFEDGKDAKTPNVQLIVSELSARAASAPSFFDAGQTAGRTQDRPHARLAPVRGGHRRFTASGTPRTSP